LNFFAAAVVDPRVGANHAAWVHGKADFGILRFLWIEHCLPAEALEDENVLLAGHQPGLVHFEREAGTLGGTEVVRPGLGQQQSNGDTDHGCGDGIPHHSSIPVGQPILAAAAFQAASWLVRKHAEPPERRLQPRLAAPR
jgi:hypothetical protein